MSDMNTILDGAAEFAAKVEAGEVSEQEMLQVKAEAYISVLELEDAIDAILGDEMTAEVQADLSNAIVTHVVMARLEQTAMIERLNDFFAALPEEAVLGLRVESAEEGE